MTEASEAIKKIQEQLVYIMQDKELKSVIDFLADIIRDIRRDPYYLSGIYYEAQRFIPEKTHYDENHWIAVYILYLGNSDLIELYKEIEAINEEIIIADKYLQMLDKELQASQEVIWALYEYIDKLNGFLEELSKNANVLYEKLSSLGKTNNRELYESILKRYYFLDDIVHAIEDRIDKANKELVSADEDMGKMKEEHESARRYLKELERERNHIVDLVRNVLEEIEHS